MLRSSAGHGFLSTLSLRRATFQPKHQYHNFGHFYPRSPCGERRAYLPMASSWYTFLSTLSLRRATELAFLAINPITFLSTLSLRRATAAVLGTVPDVAHFYPRSPCGERRTRSAAQATFIRFLSTLSLRRATVPRGPPWAVLARFLSTLSLRRATVSVHVCA